MKVTINLTPVITPPPTYTIVLSAEEAFILRSLLGGLTDEAAQQLVSDGQAKDANIDKEDIIIFTDELYKKLGLYIN